MKNTECNIFLVKTDKNSYAMATIYADTLKNCERRLRSILAARIHDESAWLAAIMPDGANQFDVNSCDKHTFCAGTSYIDAARSLVNFFKLHGTPTVICEYNTALDKYKTMAGFTKAAEALIQSTGSEL